ncbi:MAG: hypothetical protein AAGJ08_09675 [Cyanobacteria bacterium P01_H01_bin.35]
MSNTLMRSAILATKTQYYWALLKSNDKCSIITHMKCPKCNSTKTRKNGHRRGQQSATPI